MMRDSVCISVIYQYLRHIDSSLTEEFESKYQPNKDLHVDVEKLLGDWRKEQEEIKMVIYQFLRKTTSPDLAEEFRNTHLPSHDQQGQDCLGETTFANLMEAWQEMQQDTFNIVCIDDDDCDDILDGDDADESEDEDDVVILYDDDVVILDNNDSDILVDERDGEKEKNVLKQMEANIVYQYLKLVSVDLAANFKETYRQFESSPVQLQDFVEMAAKLNPAKHKESEARTTLQDEKRGSSRLGVIPKRFSDQETEMIRELMKELGKGKSLNRRGGSMQRRYFSAEEESKIEELAARMNRFFVTNHETNKCMM